MSASSHAASYPRFVLIGLAWSSIFGADRCPAADEPRPNVVLIDAGRLVELRDLFRKDDPAVAETSRSLRSRADDALKTPAVGVTDKPWLPPSGDKHDYMSLARYFWPDPSRAGGKPYVRKDGRTNPEVSKFDAPKMGRFTDSVSTLGLAYYLTADERYAEHAAKLLNAWFVDPSTRMNPNLNFGQFVPGVNDGRAAGIIETRGLIGVADAIGMLEGAKCWSKVDAEAVRAWYRSYLGWLRESAIGRKERDASNNHGTWYDVQVVAFALFVGDKPLARRVLEASREKRIARQIEPDGSMPRELTRTKSFDYSLFNLNAFAGLARLGEKAGVDLWHYRTTDGRSIRRAIDAMIPYARGEKTWTHEQIGRPNVSKLLPVLRRAANALREPSYERALAELAARGARLDGLDELLEPAASGREPTESR